MFQSLNKIVVGTRKSLELFWSANDLRDYKTISILHKAIYHFSRRMLRTVRILLGIEKKYPDRRKP